MKKLNNRGFSLVELLISIVILGIIVTPLLRSFSTSASTAKRALSIGNATVVGKNLAELVEAYPIGELVDVNNSANCFHDPERGISFDGFGANGDADSYDNANYIQMCFNSIIGGSETFKARITLDATETSGYGVQNSELISEYTEMDAVLAQSRDEANDPDKLVQDEFIAYVNNTYTDWVEEHGYTVTRNIDLYVERDPGASAFKLNATVKYSYTFSFDYITDETKPDGTIEHVTKTGSWTGIREYILFPQGFTYNEDNTTLMKYPNIYLMYYPMLSVDIPYEVPAPTPDPAASPSPDPVATPDPDAEPTVAYIHSTVLPETINIHNDEAEPFPFTLFLIKQQEPGFSREDLVESEAHYNTTIIQHQNTDPSEEPAAKIYSNAGESLVNPGTPLANVHYRIHYGSFFSGSGSFEGELGNLVKKTTKNRMYKVTVEVFDSDKDYASAPLYTFVSTKLQ